MRTSIADILRKFLRKNGGEEYFRDEKIIEEIKSRNLTYLSKHKMHCIAETCREIEKKRMNGDFIEAGCALGGSAILIASIKSKTRPLRLYDVFGMIPSPSKEDTPDVHQRYEDIVSGKSHGIGGDKYYGYEENLLEKVVENFKYFDLEPNRNQVQLIKGLLQDTMSIDTPVAFAHIDVDWYDPVKTSLERIYPHLVIGGSIILDDYFDWGGCRKATDQFLEGIGKSVKLDQSAKSLKITRVKD